MQRTELKVAIVAKQIPYWQVAVLANKRMPPEHHLSEQGITQIVTCRKRPTKSQAVALSKVLMRPFTELFPGEFEK